MHFKKYRLLLLLFSPIFFNIQAAYPDTQKKKNLQQFYTDNQPPFEHPVYSPEWIDQINTLPPSVRTKIFQYALTRRFIRLLEEPTISSSNDHHLDNEWLDAPEKHNKILSIQHENVAKIKLKDNIQPSLYLVGHSATILAGALSHDDKKAITGAALFDNTAKIWNAQTGKIIVTLSGHKGPIKAVAFSPDDNKAITGAGELDNTAKIWDVQTGKIIATLSGHKGSITAVAFSPDGTKAITGSDDKTAKIWDAMTGSLLQNLVGHGEEIDLVALSPDGTQAKTRTWKGDVKIWDLNKRSNDVQRFLNNLIDAKTFCLLKAFDFVYTKDPRNVPDPKVKISLEYMDLIPESLRWKIEKKETAWKLFCSLPDFIQAKLHSHMIKPPCLKKRLQPQNH